MEFGARVPACWGEATGACSTVREAGRSVFPLLSLDTTQKGHFSPIWRLVCTNPVVRQGYLSQPGLRAGQPPWRCPACVCRRNGAGRQQPRPPWAPSPVGPSPAGGGHGRCRLPPRSRARDDGQSQARGAAFVLKPSEDSCVWSFATLFRKMSERMMTSER